MTISQYEAKDEGNIWNKLQNSRLKSFFLENIFVWNVKIFKVFRNFLEKKYWLDWHKISIRQAHLPNLKDGIFWVTPRVLVLAQRSNNRQKKKFFVNGREKNSRKNSNTHVFGAALKGE